MPVFVVFLEHSYYSDFNYSLKNSLVQENKSKHLLFHVLISYFN